MSVGPRLGKNCVRVSERRCNWQSARLWCQTKCLKRAKRKNAVSWGGFIALKNVYWGYWITDSLVLGGILGNVVFCLNMAATCGTYTSNADRKCSPLSLWLSC